MTIQGRTRVYDFLLRWEGYVPANFQRRFREELLELIKEERLDEEQQVQDSIMDWFDFSDLVQERDYD